MELPERIASLNARVETITHRPGEVRAAWVSLARPLLKGIGWQPVYRTGRLRALLDAPTEGAVGDRDPVQRALEAAVTELTANVVQAERACVIHKRLSPSHTSWLRRQIAVIAEVARAPGDPWLRDPTVRASLRQRALAPMAVAPSKDPAPFGTEDPPEEPSVVSAAARVVDFNLSAVDALIEMSRGEIDFPGRRRQLLEAARMQLLDVSAALPLDATGVSERQRYLADEIARIDRMIAAGLRPDVSLVHQCRAALAQGDRRRLHTALVALDESARRRGDRVVSARATAALDRMWAAADRYSPTELVRSQEASAIESLGAPMLRAVREAYARARGHTQPSEFVRKFASDAERARGALDQQYFALGGEGATMAAALAAPGLFEVGGGLSPVRVIEHEARVREVRFPTQRLALSDAKSVEDLANAVIEDPRMVLLSLAEGRLLTRRYTRRESVARKRTRMVGEVRVYVLDGSGSMYMGPGGLQLGARARVRDAMMVAELATLAKRCETLGRTSRIALYYRYFNDELGPLFKVDSAESATRAIDTVLGTTRQGGTNIERALIDSFKLIATERANDPDLVSAQVVLVTDGEAPVSHRAVMEARAAVGGTLPIRLSVIALGEENPVLRALVSAQRTRGEMAFYHFIDDDTLRAIVTGKADLGQCLHAPPATALEGLSEGERTRMLHALVGDLVDDLGSLGTEASVQVDAIEHAEADALAMGELGLDGAAAWSDALKRDRRAVERRFSRWFPKVERVVGARAGSADLDCAVVLLGTVAEVIDVVSGSELARKADAIEVIERLLPATELTSTGYLALLARPPQALCDALDAVHRAVTVG